MGSQRGVHDPIESRVFAFVGFLCLRDCNGWSTSHPKYSPRKEREKKSSIDHSESDESAVLRELAEIRKAIETLQKEVGELRSKVGDIHRVAVRPTPTAPPPPDKVSLEESRALGSADAQIAIVEFSDYQCPYCARFFQQTFPALKKSYIETGKVRFYFRVYADSCGLKTAFLGNGGRNAATIFSLRYSSSR